MSTSERRIKTGLLPPARCFKEEEQAIRQKAENAGLSVGAFLVACALRKKIKNRVDKQAISELRRLGGLQKLLFMQSEGQCTAEYQTLLDEIGRAISRLAD